MHKHLIVLTVNSWSYMKRGWVIKYQWIKLRCLLEVRQLSLGRPNLSNFMPSNFGLSSIKNTTLFAQEVLTESTTFYINLIRRISKIMLIFWDLNNHQNLRKIRRYFWRRNKPIYKFEKSNFSKCWSHHTVNSNY